MLAATTFFAASTAFGHSEREGKYAYVLAKVAAGEVSLPGDKYIPFEWAVSEISADNEGVKLSLNQSFATQHKAFSLRITSATDVREVLVLEVKTAKTGTIIGEWDLRFAALLQPFELQITQEDLQAVFDEGIT